MKSIHKSAMNHVTLGKLFHLTGTISSSIKEMVVYLLIHSFSFKTQKQLLSIYNVPGTMISSGIQNK